MLFRSGSLDVGDAKGLMAKAGLGLYREQGIEHALFVPNVNPRVRGLYDDSKWAGEEGAGAWSQALRQAPEGVCRPGAMRVSGVQCRGTLICLKALYGANGVMASVGELSRSDSIGGASAKYCASLARVPDPYVSVKIIVACASLGATVACAALRGVAVSVASLLCGGSGG